MNKEFHHVSVLLKSSIEWLQIDQAHTVVDSTLGGGGHSEAILKQLPSDGRLIGIDRDIDALKAASERLSPFGDRFQAIHGNFFDIETLLQEHQIGPVDAIIADLGVSSYQLDTRERGFSYQHDAKLDMRMNQQEAISAYDVVNDYSQEELYRIIRDYGEENWAKRIAEFIVLERNIKKIETTFELTQIIKNAIPARARRTGPHPAKRTFQAIRIEVNGELDRLGEAVESMVNCLKEDGRIGIITFHSLEDRIVKHTFQKLANPCTCPPKAPMCVCGKRAQLKILSRKPILPTEEELEYNPRARSAKLRVAQKI